MNETLDHRIIFMYIYLICSYIAQSFTYKVKLNGDFKHINYSITSKNDLYIIIGKLVFNAKIFGIFFVFTFIYQ